MLVLGLSRCWRRCSPGTHTHAHTQAHLQAGTGGRGLQQWAGPHLDEGGAPQSSSDGHQGRALHISQRTHKAHTPRTVNTVLDTQHTHTQTHRSSDRTAPPLATLQYYTGGALLLPGCTAPSGVRAGEGRLLLSAQSAPGPAPGSAPSPPPPPPLGSADWKLFLFSFETL